MGCHPRIRLRKSRVHPDINLDAICSGVAGVDCILRNSGMVKFNAESLTVRGPNRTVMIVDHGGDDFGKIVEPGMQALLSVQVGRRHADAKACRNGDGAQRIVRTSTNSQGRFCLGMVQ